MRTWRRSTSTQESQVGVSQRSQLFGLELDRLTMRQLLSHCSFIIESRGTLQIGVLNAAKAVSASKDDLLRTALLDCDILVADGQPIVWASRLLGQPLPERIAGIDLFENLLIEADRSRRSVYLLGAAQEVLDRLCDVISVRFPGLTIAGATNGYFDDTDRERVADEIRGSQADMLFLGMPSPRKENFIAAFGRSLNVPVIHGVGGSFDVLAGLTKRAPLSWQRLGLEWAYRLKQEPRRMWRRYLVGNTAFLGLVVRELLQRRPRQFPAV